MLLAHALYGLAWISFGAGHSLLALPGVRRWLQHRLGGAERLAYNAVASIHITAVIAVGIALLGGASPYDLPAWVYALQAILGLIGLVVLREGSRGYDMARLTGLHQLRHGNDPGGTDAEPLVTEGLHRYVRHPLYSGGIALLWAFTWSPLGFATAIWGTLYFVLGSRAEERKLVRRYGDVYRRYRRTVPALVPWRGRVLETRGAR